MAFRGLERLKPPPTYRALRLLTIVVLSAWLPLAAWSGYRAIVQIFRLDLQASSAQLRPGTVVSAHVMTSGRAHADLVIELVQRDVRDTVARLFVPGGRDGALDPRPRHGDLQVVLAAEQLDRLSPGAAIIRATAVGRSQWFRTPPPTVREVTAQVP